MLFTFEAIITFAEDQVTHDIVGHPIEPIAHVSCRTPAFIILAVPSCRLLRVPVRAFSFHCRTTVRANQSNELPNIVDDKNLGFSESSLRECVV